MSTFRCRWIIEKDFPAILAISADCGYPLTPKRLNTLHYEPQMIGYVGEVDDVVVSYCHYLLDETSLVLMTLGVAPAYRRCGVGSAMLDKLKVKISRGGKRTSISCYVDEDAIESQLFFRANGFRCEEYFQPLDRERDGSGMLVFRFVQPDEGLEIIERIMQGDVRVST